MEASPNSGFRLADNDVCTALKPFTYMPTWPTSGGIIGSISGTRCGGSFAQSFSSPISNWYNSGPFDCSMYFTGSSGMPTGISIAFQGGSPTAIQVTNGYVAIPVGASVVFSGTLPTPLIFCLP